MPELMEVLKISRFLPYLEDLQESSKFKILLKSTWRACFEAAYAAHFEPAATKLKTKDLKYIYAVIYLF